MENVLPFRYSHLPLVQLAEKLNLDFYALLAGMCQRAEEQLAQLEKLDVAGVTGEYCLAGKGLLKNLVHVINDRQAALLPYLQTLHEKESTKHDCGNCSGKCDMQHAGHIITLQESHKRISGLLSQIQAIQMPMQSNAPYYQLYKLLCAEMKLIDTITLELLAVEEKELIPRILTAQKNINVIS